MSLIDFGKPVRRSVSKHIQGEFSFWIPGAPWRLECDGQIIAGSGQDELPPDTLECLIGDRVQEIIARPPHFDVSIIWYSGKTLRVFCENADFSVIDFFLPHIVYSLDSSGKITAD